jgi:hypothetical protein
MAEADPFATANDAYSIVVAGNMNPAIHHPAWYKLIKALSEEELASSGGLGARRQDTAETSPTEQERGVTVTIAAVDPNDPISTPGFARFTAGKIRIACIEQSWTIATFDQNLLVRIRDVASSVFEALGHTPVSAYGFNFAFHRKTGVADVGALLAQIIDATEFGFPKGVQGSRSARIGYTLSDGGRDLNVSVEKSARGAGMIFVGINTHHRIVRPGTGFGEFDLTPLLRDGVEKGLQDAQEVLSRLTRTLAEKAGDSGSSH